MTFRIEVYRSNKYGDIRAEEEVVVADSFEEAKEQIYSWCTNEDEKAHIEGFSLLEKSEEEPIMWEVEYVLYDPEDCMCPEPENYAVQVEAKDEYEAMDKVARMHECEYDFDGCVNARRVK